MSFLEQLPEVIEQIGRDVKAITVVLGKGRPDKPDTTGDKITGEEPKIKGNLVSCHMGGLQWGLFGYLGKTEKGYSPRQAGRVEVISQGGYPSWL